MRGNLAETASVPVERRVAVRDRTIANFAMVARIVLLTVALVVTLVPFYWMLRTAVTPQSEPLANGISLIPAHLYFGNFGRAWASADLGTALTNGVIVTGSIVILQICTCVPAAYAFAKMRFRWSGALFGGVLGCLLIPTQATMVPTFIGINAFGLADTRVGLVLPFTSSAFGIFLLRQQMLTIPDSLLDAAKSDGLGPLRTLFHVVVPLSMPAIAAFAMFSVFAHWNDYLWPLLVARSSEIYTPPLSLAIFQQTDVTFDYSALAAGAIIVTAPVLILFLMAQRHLVRGLSGGEGVGQ